MFVEIFVIFLKYTKVSCFYFLKDSAKLHRNIYYVLYALKNVRVSTIFCKKILSPKMCVEIFLIFFLNIQKRDVVTS